MDGPMNKTWNDVCNMEQKDCISLFLFDICNLCICQPAWAREKPYTLCDHTECLTSFWVHFCPLYLTLMGMWLGVSGCCTRHGHNGPLFGLNLQWVHRGNLCQTPEEHKGWIDEADPHAFPAHSPAHPLHPAAIVGLIPIAAHQTDADPALPAEPNLICLSLFCPKYNESQLIPIYSLATFCLNMDSISLQKVHTHYHWESGVRHSIPQLIFSLCYCFRATLKCMCAASLEAWQARWKSSFGLLFASTFSSPVVGGGAGAYWGTGLCWGAVELGAERSFPSEQRNREPEFALCVGGSSSELQVFNSQQTELNPVSSKAGLIVVHKVQQCG